MLHNPPNLAQAGARVLGSVLNDPGGEVARHGYYLNDYEAEWE